MQHSNFLFATILMGVISSVTAENGWTNGRNSTGMTDPNVTSNCTYWANDISSNATCEQVQEHFDIDFNHLHAWNPSLLKDYCVLIQGLSYCVDGPAVTTDTTANATAPVLYLPSTTTATAFPSGTESNPTSALPRQTASAAKSQLSTMLVLLGSLVFSTVYV